MHNLEHPDFEGRTKRHLGLPFCFAYPVIFLQEVNRWFLLK